jgi:hypothetical protein
MTALERALSDYLTLRWRLGYKLARPGQLLGQFVAYLDDVGAQTVTIERAVEWATQPAGADPNWWAYRLDAVRGFAAYLHTLDPTVPLVPRDLLPYRSRRATPEAKISGRSVAKSLQTYRIPRSPARSASRQQGPRQRAIFTSPRVASPP